MSTLLESSIIRHRPAEEKFEIMTSFHCFFRFSYEDVGCEMFFFLIYDPSWRFSPSFPINFLYSRLSHESLILASHFHAANHSKEQFFHHSAIIHRCLQFYLLKLTFVFQATIIYPSKLAMLAAVELKTLLNLWDVKFCPSNEKSILFRVPENKL